MKQVVFTFLVFFSHYVFGQNPKTTPLELIQLSQMTPYDSLQFDLSGIVEVNNRTFIIADKKWNQCIYEVALTDSCFYVKNEIPIQINDRLDLEAIDYCNSLFYLANEQTGNVYTISIDESKQTVSTLPLDFKSTGHKLDQWKNTGWEGLAVDCEEQKLYLTKERHPRIVFTIDLKTNKVISEFNISEINSNDFSDAKFNKGYLYLLERNGNYISKINPKTQQVVSKVTYKHITSHANGKLYTNSKHGLAEGLLLQEDEIWIALDNNGNQVSAHAIATYNMKGKSPVILRFKRPKSF